MSNSLKKKKSTVLERIAPVRRNLRAFAAPQRLPSLSADGFVWAAWTCGCEAGWGHQVPTEREPNSPPVPWGSEQWLLGLPRGLSGKALLNQIILLLSKRK